MARGVGSRYDFATMDELHVHFQDVSKRLDDVAFSAGAELGRVQRDLATRLDGIVDSLEGRAVRETRRVNEEMATVYEVIGQLDERLWKLEHPWRARWSVVRAWMRRTIHRD